MEGLTGMQNVNFQTRMLQEYVHGRDINELMPQIGSADTSHKAFDVRTDWRALQARTIKSISTRTSRGRRAASTVERAGGFAGK